MCLHDTLDAVCIHVLHLHSSLQRASTNKANISHSISDSLGATSSVLQLFAIKDFSYLALCFVRQRKFDRRGQGNPALSQSVWVEGLRRSAERSGRTRELVTEEGKDTQEQSGGGGGWRLLWLWLSRPRPLWLRQGCWRVRLRGKVLSGVAAAVEDKVVRSSSKPLKHRKTSSLVGVSVKDPF